jgi:hypothetical protein
MSINLALNAAIDSYYGKQGETWQCYRHKNDYSFNDLQFFTALSDDGKKAIVAFQGSVTEQKDGDWLKNFSFFPRKNKKTSIPLYTTLVNNGFVHSGFYISYQQGASTIQDFIKQHYFNVEKIIITGHSKGAALVAVCALDLYLTFTKLSLTNRAYQSNFLAKIECYAFSSPRVVNKTFAQFIDDKIKFNNIWVAGDPVHDVPFTLLGYRHIGKGQKLGSRFQKLSHYLWAALPISLLFAPLSLLKISPFVLRHSPSYLASLINAKKWPKLNQISKLWFLGFIIPIASVITLVTALIVKVIN